MPGESRTSSPTPDDALPQMQRTVPETSGADWWLLVMVALAAVAASSLVVVAAVLWLR